MIEEHLSSKLFQQKILAWFQQHGRKDLPWQQDITPYRVWVSEIMLQQTQVATVIPYFQRFIAQYPTVEQLASASLDEVLGLWSGLGYYARARNLHQSAQLIVERDNSFPQDLASLMELPGIGKSTAGAILSIACGQSHPILDGNVKRVFTRFRGIFGWPGDHTINRQLWDISQQYTPQSETAAYTQAMMDLGATVCTRTRPKCQSCPLQRHCYAALNQQTRILPTPRPRRTLRVKEVFFLLVVADGAIALYKRPPAGIWGGLWSPPEFNSLEALWDWCRKRNLSTEPKFIGNRLRHTFSHYHLDYTPVIIESKRYSLRIGEPDHSCWYRLGEPASLGLPAPIKSLLQTLEDLRE